MDIDWKESCMQILGSDTSREGRLFEDDWISKGMKEDVAIEIEHIFRQWQKQRYPCFAYKTFLTRLECIYREEGIIWTDFKSLGIALIEDNGYRKLPSILFKESIKAIRAIQSTERQMDLCFVLFGTTNLAILNIQYPSTHVEFMRVFTNYTG